MAQTAWVLAALASVALLIASLEGYFVWFQGRNPMQPGPEPYNVFYVLGGAASLAIAVICLGLSFLVFRRRRDDPMALFVSFYVLIYGVILAGPLETLDVVVAGASQLAIGVLQPIFLTVPTVALIVLFPDGRPVPKWSRWLIPLGAASLAFLPFLDAKSASALNTLPAQLWAALLVILFGLAVACQVHRYRRVSSPAAREQTRWVVLGLATWLVLMLVQGLPYIYLQNLPPGAPLPVWAAVSTTVWWLSLAAIPLTLTIAILRHRLYDIDIIINRALVYGALTAILAGLYAASISFFQKLFQALTGQKSDAAVVLTTLVLASAFTPVRSRLQSTVDRRFKDVHDARRRLEALAEEIRQAPWMVSPEQASRRLLHEAVEAFDAEGGAVYLGARRRERLTHTIREWKAQPTLTVPLAGGGREFGRLALGPRKHDGGYTSEDADLLARTAETVAAAFPGGAPRRRARRASGDA